MVKAVTVFEGEALLLCTHLFSDGRVMILCQHGIYYLRGKAIKYGKLKTIFAHGKYSLHFRYHGTHPIFAKCATCGCRRAIGERICIGSCVCFPCIRAEGKDKGLK